MELKIKHRTYDPKLSDKPDSHKTAIIVASIYTVTLFVSLETAHNEKALAYLLTGRDLKAAFIKQCCLYEGAIR